MAGHKRVAYREGYRRHGRQTAGLPAVLARCALRRAGGNKRLTAMTGAVLLILLLIECYTILRIGRLLTLHVFLGVLLLGPVSLKRRRWRECPPITCRR